ncbi:MAG TPA: DUF5309 domain-containing protein [Stellaceae bacterium]|nr:DUF5309 domain-containing protein [Stellaceae bacterium]
MATIANTFLTFSAIGNREDLVDEIYMISPTDTPFQANIGKVKARAVLHEWQPDSLAAAATNAQLEGDDIQNFAAVIPTSRVNNRCQISYKDVIVSGTQDAVSKAGRKKEMVYQLMKRTKELRRDIEFTLCGNQAPVTGNSTTPRQLRPLCGWYATNTARGAGGASGSPTAAATDGTQRALTESLVKSMIQAAWTQGGEPDLIMSGPFNKTVISTFTGNNTRMQDTTDRKLVAAIDIYVSDFGTHKVVANKFSRDRDLHILTTDLWAVANLRPMKTVDLAKTGDAEKGMVIAEYTLEARNEAGSAIVADLTTQ